MADALCPASASVALVLADKAHEEALELWKGSKRSGDRGLDGQPVLKRGKRWGLSEDKPFRPLPFLDIPVGLDEEEVEQFMREQRLEDLHRKIQFNQLEDVDPDIRPPSPPPVYDRAGNRLNTRETRIRKAMIAEYNRLIRYMIKTVEGYIPPLEWRPQKLSKKIIIPTERYPHAPFMGVIIGARGVNHKRLQEVTGCKIFIRGKEVGDKFQTDEEMQMPQHVHIEGDTEEQIEQAEKLIKPLLDPESAEFEYARTNGMQQIAIVNGFTVKKTEQRCGICGAIGHLGFECPEIGDGNYKMANVVCTICGDKGHVASDCKQAAEQHQRENVDWKADAEKKQEMESEYQSMMEELGIKIETSQAAVTSSAPSAPQPKPAPSPRPPRPNWASRPRGPAVNPSTGLSFRPGLGASAEQQPSAAPACYVPPRHRRPEGGPAPFQGSVARPAMPTPAPRPEVDRSVVCPPELLPRVTENAFAILREMGSDTGCYITLGELVDGRGSRRFRISGPAESLESAKMHLQVWLEVNGGGATSPAMAPPTGMPAMPAPCMPQGMPPPGMPPPGMPPHPLFPAGGSAVPSGFPPGFAPPGGAGAMPAGFPPGFPLGAGFLPTAAGVAPGLGVFDDDPEI